LYLENNLVPGVFTPARISLLNILSTQAAVSLENAELYNDLTSLNSKLTVEIHDKELAQKALEENERRLEEYNSTLEQKVEERTQEIKAQKDVIEEEKQKSEELLRNILPEETAIELKEKGRSVPRRYENTTVLFTDFVDFSRISENITPDVLVNEIHYYYSAFDEIIAKYALEKIKTIGDSYMCACGLPVEDPNHAINSINAAMEIASFVEDTMKNRSQSGEVHFSIRIGLHSGPVVAGIVGKRKFAYDIWGDTVNVASRMESNSEPGKINITEQTYEIIKNQFKCTYRGKISVKNKGEIGMYFVDSKI
jgi:class 3 adenylate cyclase